MLFIVLLDFLGIVKYCLLGYSFDKTSWLFNQNGWFILLLARACYPAKHVHLSSIYPRLWDHETFETPLLPKNASHQPPAIGISRNQGPTKQTKKNTTHHHTFSLQIMLPSLWKTMDLPWLQAQTTKTPKHHFQVPLPGPPSFQLLRTKNIPQEPSRNHAVKNKST